jgi:hypothetical protein
MCPFWRASFNNPVKCEEIKKEHHILPGNKCAENMNCISNICQNGVCKGRFCSYISLQVCQRVEFARNILTVMLICFVMRQVKHALLNLSSDFLVNQLSSVLIIVFVIRKNVFFILVYRMGVLATTMRHAFLAIEVHTILFKSKQNIKLITFWY